MLILGKRVSKNVSKNVPGPRQTAKGVQTPLKALPLFMSDEMLNDLVKYTKNSTE